MSVEPLLDSFGDRAESVPEYYADSLNMSIGPYGFGLEFGLMPFPDTPPVADGSAPLLVARPTVRVRVSPQMAKAIRDLVVNNVSIFESVFGEIRIPEDHLRVGESSREGGAMS